MGAVSEHYSSCFFGRLSEFEPMETATEKREVGGKVQTGTTKMGEEPPTL